MTQALSDNVAGHKLKWEKLSAHFGEEEAKVMFVGNSDPIMTGYTELEAVRFRRSVKGASVVDIGCGIGRLTQHMLHEDISAYLGLDIVPQILDEARKIAGGDSRFRFDTPIDCKIPLGDAEADVVVAYSVITHLMDEEIFDYLLDARRVLRPGGFAFFSFLDFFNNQHQADFFKHVQHHRQGQGDILAFTTRDVLALFGDRAGFSNVEFLDGTEDQIPHSGASSALIPSDKIPPFVRTGQSLCILRV